jgi:uncharacterized repeat protein (TIGR04138 family)
MHKQNLAELVDRIVRQDPRYDRDAYTFVREGLDYTLKMLQKRGGARPAHRHVSGQELLEGLRQYALEQFGPMAKTVLEHWGVHKCEDFGEIVFNMVDHGILGKTPEDSRADFQGGYDFTDAFVRPFQPRGGPPHRARAARRVTPAEAARDNPRGTGSKKLSSGSN